MKKTSLRTIGAIVALLITYALPAAAQNSTASEVEQLRSALKQMQTNMDQLNARIAQLEKENTATTASQAAQQPAVMLGSGGTPAETPAVADEVKDGYIAVPKTGLKVRFNVKPKLDITADNRNSGNPDRFVTALIPTENNTNINYSGPYTSTSEFNMNMRATQLAFDAASIDPQGKFRLHYDNDFFGAGDNDLNFRINQLYIQFGGLLIGKAILPLEDPDMWFDTLDYEGASSMIYARAAQVRYNFDLQNGWTAAASVSKPGESIDTPASIAGRHRLPDFSANIRWDHESFGHVQLSTMLRDLATGTGDPKGGQDVLGWGFNLSTGINVSSRDSFQIQGTYGQGIFNYINDSFKSGDATYDFNNNLKALTYKGFLIGYAHRWNDIFRSSTGYSTAIIDNIDAQAADAYHRTQYAYANIIWTALPRLDIGFELLYGWNKVKNGDKGDVFRAQVSFGYSLF